MSVMHSAPAWSHRAAEATRRKLSWAVSLVALALGCSGGTGGPTGSANSCPSLQGACTYTSLSCTEYGGFPAAEVAQYQRVCAMSGRSMWSTNPCDTHRALGGCRAANANGCVVSWQFPPGQAADLERDCAARGDTWVPP